MTALAELKHALRARSEQHLRVAVLRELGRGQPSTVEPYQPPGGWFWRLLFVPVYRRIPWGTKERIMRALGMTAHGWREPPRRPGTPWRPPVRAAPEDGARRPAGSSRV